MKRTYRWFLFLLIVFAGDLFGQVTPAKLRQFVNSGNLPGIINPSNQNDLQEFYTILEYHPAWFRPHPDTNRNVIFNLLKNADALGLEEKDYQFDFIMSLHSGSVLLNSTEDSLNAEIILTDAALAFFHDMLYGNTIPILGYDGLNYTPSCFNIPALLADRVINNSLPGLFQYPEDPAYPIKAIRSRIEWLRMILNNPGFKEEMITSTKVNADNKPLCKKLFYLGLLDSIDRKLPDKELKEKVKEAQRQLDLLADGVLRSTALQALNIPVKTRLKQLNLSLNYYRWLYCLAQQEPVIVVNIPAAYLKVYYGTDVILETRMIVGKPSTPTPTLSSRIHEVILYPYWMVPFSIATKELLPEIQRNPGYIDAGNYQVLNNRGKTVNPDSVDWSLLSAKNFPYTIRQSTGCDNALGLIKLDFYNPFSVYLHDTPDKSLFMFNKRYFSHGCMRLEDPMELGHLVLKNNPMAIDTLEEKGCLRNQFPIRVAADQRMPVIVWYNPVGTDSTGRVIYYEDVYKKFRWGQEN